MVITRPHYDDTTAYLHAWSSKVIEAAEKNNFKIIDLDIGKANRENLESVLEKKNPIFVSLNGHGSRDSVFGQDHKFIVQSGINEKFLANTITYALSCDSASGLGRAAVDSGAKAYIGYTEPFGFVFDENYTTKPLHDTMAKPFFEASNKVSIELLKGKSVQESVEKSQEVFQKWIDFYRHSKELEAPSILTWLIWDKMIQELIGDKEAKIF